MVTPLGWLMRVPTFKEKVRQMDETEETVNYGLVGYPVLQTADIILYKADTVPVGQDQVPHLELAREIVRRFNNTFGDTFPEPQAKLTEAPLLVGLDGQAKMSKSLDNHLDLAATPEDTAKRLMTAFTDPQRTTRNIPGRPGVCNVYSLHQMFTAPAQVTAVYDECATAARGCVDCKRELAASINGFLEPMRERRREYESRPGYVREILDEGGKRARAIAIQHHRGSLRKNGPGLASQVSPFAPTITSCRPAPSHPARLRHDHQALPSAARNGAGPDIPGVAP